MENTYYTPMSAQRAQLRKEWNAQTKTGVKDWEEYLNNAEIVHKIQSAKQILKDNGYFVDNLWSVDDVKSKYECSDEQAQTVLNDVLTGEWFIGEINASIDITADAYNLNKRVSKYFSVSGFWKDAHEDIFEDYIIKELDIVDEDEDIDILFYGLNEEGIKAEIEIGEGTALEFVITSYEETTVN